MPMSKKGAVAVFVKTPGRSPLPRLTDAIGAEAADEYLRLVEVTVEEIVAEAAELHGNVEAYWALPDELADDPRWGAFQRIKQGSGGAGERMHRVYDELLRKHPYVLLLDAAVPQLTPESLQKAIERAELFPGTFVLGRAESGDFYLFSGSVKLPRKLWLSLPYGDAACSDELVSHLQPFGEVFDWDPLFEVESAEDLTRLGETLDQAESLLPAQNTLADWILARQAPKR